MVNILLQNFRQLPKVVFLLDFYFYQNWTIGYCQKSSLVIGKNPAKTQLSAIAENALRKSALQNSCFPIQVTLVATTRYTLDCVWCKHHLSLCVDTGASKNYQPPFEKFFFSHFYFIFFSLFLRQDIIFKFFSMFTSIYGEE